MSKVHVEPTILNTKKASCSLLKYDVLDPVSKVGNIGVVTVGGAFHCTIAGYSNQNPSLCPLFLADKGTT